MSDNLLPCPFCGERAHMHAVNGPYCGNFECALHLVSGFNLDAWNKRAWQAARTVPEGMMVVSAKWLERHAGPEDHACVRCYPHSDMIIDGFSCYYHKALDVIAAAPEPKQ